jgi:hypothetical protein
MDIIIHLDIPPYGNNPIRVFKMWYNYIFTGKYPYRKLFWNVLGVSPSHRDMWDNWIRIT